MKQLLQYLRNGKTVVTDVPAPSVRPGMALVRTSASLVSAGTERMLVEFAEKSLIGKARSRPDLVRQMLDKARREGPLSTLDAAFNRLDQPMPLGYSSAGTIAEVGRGLEGFQVGDRVACAGGGFAVHAEWVVVPQNLMARLPDTVDFESASFTTLAAIALHGFRLAQPQVGDRVAVIGMGLLGLLAAGIARAAGCHVFGVDLAPDRLALAQKMGFTAVARPQAEAAAQTFTHGRGFDHVLICADTTSNDPITLAGAIARDRGNVIAVGAVGLGMPRKVYYEKELHFQVSRSYGPGRYDPGYEEAGRDYPIGFVRWTEGRNLESVVDLLASGVLDVRPLITHRFPITRAADAYELITGKTKQPFLGVLLTYPQEAETEPLRRIALPNRAQNTAASPLPGVGVLGSGNYATAVFLPTIQKAGGVRPVGVASGSGLTARHAAEKFGYAFAASSEDELFDHPDIQILAVLTRHNHHARQVLRALKSGKHVFCEKPLALHAADLEEIAEALRAPNAPLLSLGFNRRFAPLAQQMRAFLPPDEPRVVHYRVNAGFLPSTHWLHDPAVGGGRIIGEGCHFFDFLTFLIGQSPSEVWAQSLPDDGRYHQDNAVIHLRYPDGSLGTIEYLANGDKSFPKERVEVFSAGAVAVLDDFRSLELVRDGRRQMIRSRLRQDKGHLAGWQAFLSAVQAGGQPPIPYPQIWGTTLATFAAVESLSTGRPVALPVIQEE